MRKGQVSTEITIVIGFVILIMLPVLFGIYLRINESNESLALSQANTAATRLAYTIDSVGNLGSNSSIVTELKIPPYVTAIYATGTPGYDARELVFGLTTSKGTTEIVKMTRFKIIVDGSMLKVNKPGTYNVEVTPSETAGGVVLKLYSYS